jgi:hypothetical protein
MNSFLIVEKEFIQQLSLDNMNAQYQDELLEYLQNKIYGFHLICDITDVNEFVELSSINPIWKALADKNICFAFVDRCDLEKINENNEITHALILLSDKNETSIYLEYEGFIIKPGTLDEAWSEIKKKINSRPLSVTKSNIIHENEKFDSWKCLETVVSPVRDLIIFDKHILDDKDDQNMSDNLLELLTVLLGKSSNQINKKHITIISEFERNIKNITSKELTTDAKTLFERIHKRIEDHLEANGITNFELNLIRHHKSKYPDRTILGEKFEGFHGRYIISNYFRLRCDNSFNFFKRNGNINSDTELTISFTLLNAKRSKQYKDLIDFKSYINRVENDENSYQTEPRRTMFYPNKNNPLIDFLQV